MLAKGKIKTRLTGRETQVSTPHQSVDEVLERAQMGPYRWGLYAVCILLMSIEGYDAYVVSNLAAVIARGLSIPIPSMGFVFTAQAAGMALGYYTIPLLADRVGRRMIVVIGSALFGLLTLASTLAVSLEQFTLVRFLAFAALGGTMPSIVALFTEFAPSAQRGRLVTWLFISYGLGASAAGLFGPFLVELHSWRAAFWAGGALLLVVVPFLYFFFPESCRFLVLKNPKDERIGRLLRRIDPQLVVAPGTHFVTTEVTTRGLPLVNLFRDGRTPMTLLLWLAMGAALCATTTLTAWIPSFLHVLGGLDTTTATRMSAASAFGAIAGPVLLTALFKRMSMPLALVLTFTSGGILMSLLALVAGLPALGWALCLAFGLLVIGAQAGLNSLVATSYPTSIRSTGLGWAGGIGRITSMIGPGLGAAMLAAHWGPWVIYPAIASPLFLAAIALLILHRTQRGAVVPAPAAEGQRATA